MVAGAEVAQSCASKTDLDRRLALLCLDLKSKSQCVSSSSIARLVVVLCDIGEEVGSKQCVYGLNLRKLRTKSVAELEGLLQRYLKMAERTEHNSIRYPVAMSAPKSKTIVTRLRIELVRAFLAVHAGSQPRLDRVMNELDFRYARLNTNITPVDKYSADYRLLETTIVNGRYQSMKVLEIFEIDRNPESSLFVPKKNSRTSLYYHGTHWHNLPSIFEHGLKLRGTQAGKHGRVHGQGLYFTDTAQIALSYCLDSGRRLISGEPYEEGYLLVVELCLGETVKRGEQSCRRQTIVNHDVEIGTIRLTDGTILPQNLSQIVAVQQETRIKLRFLIHFREFDS